MSNVNFILLIVLILALVGFFPVWPHAGFGYGYWPSGFFFLVLMVVLILILLKKL